MVAASDLKRALLAGLAVAVLAVAGLGLAEVLDVGVLVDPEATMAASGPAAVLGVALLVADVALPVPSSLVMVAHGALFGAVAGAVLNLVGRTGSALAGVLLGRGLRRGGGDEKEGGRGARLVERWGLAAVILTRPVPVLAESTVVAAGALGLPVPAVVAAAALGAVPEAVVYALAGAAAVSSTGAAVIFAAVVALSAAVAVGGTVAARRRCRPADA